MIEGVRGGGGALPALAGTSEYEQSDRNWVLWNLCEKYVRISMKEIWRNLDDPPKN